jgi:(3,5-dihydroxyphenyl)acetyl-CoA 1,2-dioxygenase
MSSAAVHLSFQTWFDDIPRLCGDPQQDAGVLARYVATGEAYLAGLGPKSRRAAEDASRAKSIHANCRELRRKYLGLHAEWLYGALTDGYSTSKHLQELASDAAAMCPGLIPSLLQMEKERALRQKDKEGREIDQGIFFQALLSRARIGRHLMAASLRPTSRALDLTDRFVETRQLDLGSVEIRECGHAAYLTINNRHCLNAEDERLVEDMETAVDLALLNERVQVGVIRGGVMTHPRYQGRRVFSAGINLKALHAGQISFVGFLLRRELGLINKMYRGLSFDREGNQESWDKAPRALEKPWIAVVDSFAIGGGTQLLLVCDRILAASDSYISLPAAQEGIVPGFANLRLTRFLGNRTTRQLLLFGRRIFADDRESSLLLDEVVTEGQMDVALKRNVEQLSHAAVAANRHMLHAAEEPIAMFLDYAAEFALVQSERLYSDDVLGKEWPVRPESAGPNSSAPSQRDTAAGTPNLHQET